MVKEIVAFKGQDRCGKDTTADILKELYVENNITYETIAFADILKSIIADLLMVDVDKLNNMKNDNVTVDVYGLEMTTREYIIHVSNTLHGNIGNTFITNVVKDYIETIDVEVLIITDIRFKFEYDFLINTNLTFNILEIQSTNRRCGENGLTYDLDKILSDYIIYNDVNGKGKLKEQLINIFNF